MFILDLLPQIKLARVDRPQGRLYEVNGSAFYSVTTMLAKTNDNQTLQAWKKRVGKKEADRVSQEATKKGTSLHTLIENALLGKDVSFSSDQEQTRFNQVFDFLSSEINTLRGLELSLFSTRLQLAGTCDLLYLTNNNELILGDLKTSKRFKRKEWLEDYFHQITAYSLMVYERYNLPISKGKIIISIENGRLQIEEFNVVDHLDSFYERVKRFHLLLEQEQTNATL